MKTLKKCFVIDYSGSTEGDTFYHNSVKSILDEKYNNEDNIIIWDTITKFTSYNEYMKINKYRKGNSGTSPKSIFELFKNKEKKKIILNLF